MPCLMLGWALFVVWEWLIRTNQDMILAWD
jgi:hypothetical protein